MENCLVFGKKALIILIRKLNKKASSPESYKPIGITNFSWKLMEKLIFENFALYLCFNDLLPAEKHGFGRGHSPEDQILNFGQKMWDPQNIKPSNHTTPVFLNLSKAFDQAWRNKLVIKLFNSFGIKDEEMRPSLGSLFL
ncbi:putative RNA-directed DNA polymerase from transposon BS [Nephila pilipes]|uniref:Putative RNA-directed DNA polymerase from transposon BS n=1 Tax=Nephila pilipes TaxID=299642 RepID=A0A8X6MBS3_NEPPI|nr:putative RNA-directed DNA polymerase from transposon BS [Nephila pilipes]